MSETKILASYVVNGTLAEIPGEVLREARRSLVNFMGCAVGGARDEAVDAAISAFRPFAGAPTANVLGRDERLDPLHASLMNGISSHVYDYDDTTPKNYCHPTSPIASALFAYASVNPVRGRDFMEAFIYGFEASSRVANCVYPTHYDLGWHITGTAGVFGAAAAIGKLMRLTEQQMIWALGLAGTQAAGVREMFGSMGKAFHPGRAAQNGYGAALLAQAGFTAGPRILEGPRGFPAVTTAARFNLANVTKGLGTEFDLLVNTYKPYPCGIVIHPTIDGAIQLREQHGVAPGDIAAVRLRVAPLVLDLCNQQGISTGLQGKFSVYHGAAIGLVRGKAGVQEYTDAAVNDPDIKRVREGATATADPAVTEDQAGIEVELRDGRRLSLFVEQSLGNINKPLSDRQLDAKFRDQAVANLPAGDVERLIELTWKLEELADVSEIVQAAVPASARFAAART
ncbi:MAG TPA: MmgE/PrpD family protein [Vicinamibacterales bacterium]|nr:MmgE/PrpD family protein [Vicinamibacterales bacterium]